MRSLFGRLRGAISLSLCPLCLCGSLKKDVGRLKGCDSEALRRNRFLGSGGGAIAVWEVGGGAIAIWEV